MAKPVTGEGTPPVVVVTAKPISIVVFPPGLFGEKATLSLATSDACAIVEEHPHANRRPVSSASLDMQAARQMCRGVKGSPVKESAEGQVGALGVNPLAGTTRDRQRAAEVHGASYNM